MKNLEETVKLLNQIEKNPESTQRELVGQLNISLGKVNFLINALAEKGLVKLKRFKKSKKKKGYLYLLTPQGIKSKTDLTKHFLKSKIEEYKRLEQEIEEYTLILANDEVSEKKHPPKVIPVLEEKGVALAKTGKSNNDG
ncbi:MAG: MarR family EPS-associated transcriptional regulator [Caldisericia bacterium]|nr:MarR family EPS-associated transcriptional regulator [Caldisericia bacterium]